MPAQTPTESQSPDDVDFHTSASWVVSHQVRRAAREFSSLLESQGFFFFLKMSISILLIF
jgi:hypothetical protein